MLDKLIDILVAFWEQVNPFVIIDHYEAGIHMRLGRKVRDMDIGFHFVPLKLLFIDKVLTVHTKKDTFHVSNVNVTTTDSKTVSVGAIIEYEVVDPTLYLIETNDAMSNMHDIARGVIADYLTDCTWEEIKQKPTLTKIKNRMKPQFQDMGVSIKQILFGDIAQSRTFTIFKDNSTTTLKSR